MEVSKIRILMKKTIFIAVSLIAVGIIGRLIPHIPNATPLAAITLMSGIYLNRRWSVLLPLVVLLLTDLLIGFYDWRIMVCVYASTLVTSIIVWMVKRKDPILMGFALLISSLSFFLITNGAVWYFSPWYEKSLSGLFYAYELGLPFLRNMFLGDIIYSSLLLASIIFFNQKKYIGIILKQTTRDSIILQSTLR